jgi:hypothetical protein
VSAGASLVLNLITTRDGVGDYDLSVVVAADTGGVAGGVASSEVGFDGVAGKSGGRAKAEEVSE